MPNAFDPYYVWLGIPPDEQPADHYRLLGLRTFESNADVIDHAADRQMTHLRSFSTGERAESAQRLLNEVSAARICLHDGEAKTKYDAQLRAATAAAATPAPKTTPPARPVARAIPIETASPKSPLPASERPPVIHGATSARRSKQSSPAVIAIVVGGIVVLAGLLILRAINSDATVADNSKDGTTKRGPDKSTAPSKPNEPPTTPTTPPQPSPPTDPRPLPPDNPQPPKDPPTKIPPQPADPQPDKQPTPKPIPEPKPDPADPKDPPPVDPDAPFESLLDPKIPNSPPPTPANRLAVPDESAHAAKTKEIRDLFAKEFADTRPQEIWDFGRKLLTLARETAGDPSGRYATLTLAIDRAAKIGDSETSIAAAEEIARQFEVDRLTVVGEALIATTRGGVPLAARVTATRHADQWTRTLFAADRLDLARRLAEEWTKLAAQTRDATAIADARTYKDRIAAAQQTWPDVVKATETLQATPDDGPANATVGRYLAFIKGDWPRGLDHLVKSDDAELKPLAQADRAAKEDPNASVDVADRWAELAKSAAKAETQQIAAHAVDRYASSLATATGLTKKRALDGIHDLQLEHGVWLDILATVAPQRDKVVGDWITTSDDDVSGAIGGGTGSLNTIVEPHSSYEFTTAFTRLGPSGDIYYFMPVGDRACVIALSGHANSVSWIDAIDGHRATKENPTVVRPPGIASDVRHTLHATVRITGSTVQLLVRLDGRDYMGFRGNLKRVARHKRFDDQSNPSRLGIGVYQTQVLFHSLKYRAIR